MELTDILAGNPGIVPRSAVAGVAPIHVPTNADKLALTGLIGGEIVVIDLEAGRVEMYVAGPITDDASWAVLRNTVNLTIENNNSSNSFNGVSLAEFQNQYVNVGWVDPLAVPYANTDDSIDHITQIWAIDPITDLGLLLCIINSMIFSSNCVFALPTPIQPRGNCQAVLNGGIQG